MSSALGISAVTAALVVCLNDVYTSANLGSVTVSAKAPDLAQASAGGASAALQVNLFLHQVTPNASWRNVDMPWLAADGKTHLKNPPLALDLHYLLTAYAAQDCEAEALLGFAALFFHETPVLQRQKIRDALQSAHLPANIPHGPLLRASGLANQIEMVKITPETLGREEMAWLWTALKADYRPTFPLQVSVVLIEPQLPVASALPVLSRGISLQAGGPSGLFEVQLPNHQAVVVSGDDVTVAGQSLSGVSLIALTNRRLGVPYPPFAPASATASAITFKIPNDPTNLPAGVYDLAALFVDGGGNITNSVAGPPLAIAPAMLAAPPPIVANNAAGTLVTLGCNPQILPNQTASLALSSISAPAEPFDLPTAAPSFQFPTLATGKYLARLRVDGVESPIDVTWSATPPAFAGPWVTV